MRNMLIALNDSKSNKQVPSLQNPAHSREECCVLEAIPFLACPAPNLEGFSVRLEIAEILTRNEYNWTIVNLFQMQSIRTCTECPPEIPRLREPQHDLRRMSRTRYCNNSLTLYMSFSFHGGYDKSSWTSISESVLSKSNWTPSLFRKFSNQVFTLPFFENLSIP